MGWIFVDKEEGGSKEQMRSQMRRNMRSGGYRSYGGGESYRDGYREGYKAGYEDGTDDENDENYRRSRDSRGRYM